MTYRLNRGMRELCPSFAKGPGYPRGFADTV